MTTNTTVDLITKKMLDPRWRKQHAWGGEVNPHYRFIQEGTITILEEAEVKVHFKNHGWGNVLIVNSEELGAKPGWFQVSLFNKIPDC